MYQLQFWCNQMQMEMSGVAFTHTKADTSLGHGAKGGKPQLSVLLPRNIILQLSAICCAGVFVRKVSRPVLTTSLDFFCHLGKKFIYPGFLP